MKTLEMEMAYAATLPTSKRCAIDESVIVSCPYSFLESDEVYELDDKLVKMYQDIRQTLQKEWEVISIVFPSPGIVMQTFIQRIFAQSVRLLDLYSHLSVYSRFKVKSKV